MDFEFNIITLVNQDQTISVQRGPLLYAEHIEHEEFYIKGKKPFHDRGYKPKNLKDIKLLVKDDSVVIKEIKTKINEASFYDNEIIIVVEAYDVEKAEVFDLELKPYGLSTLRRTHFNKLNK